MILGVAPEPVLKRSHGPEASGSIEEKETPGTADVIVMVCLGGIAPWLEAVNCRVEGATWTEGGRARISRMRLLPVSAMNTPPTSSTATAMGEESHASRAAPPSPP